MDTYNDGNCGDLRNYLKTMCVGRELPFDKLRANVFFSEEEEGTDGH